MIYSVATHHGGAWPIFQYMVGLVSGTGIQYSDTWWDWLAGLGSNIQIHGGIGQLDWDRYMVGSVGRSGIQYSDTWWDQSAGVGFNIQIHDEIG
jgi:hypothetical protein